MTDGEQDPVVPFASVYDLSTNPDSDWLRRELGIVVEAGSADEIVARARAAAGPIGLVATDPVSPRAVVDHAPPGSLVVLQLYDERYTAAAFDLAVQPAVTRVFRTFSIDPVPAAQYASTVLAAARDVRVANTDVRQVGAAFRSGRSIRRAVHRYGRSPVPVTNVPIGYTGPFAAAFADRFGRLPAGTSLFDVIAARPDLVPDAGRDLDVSFRGARGQHQRRTGVDLASRLPRSDCTAPFTKFSGTGQGLDADTYVDLMCRSRFALCPPGFSANESYRVYEALLCGALPTMLTAVVSQGTQWADGLDGPVIGPSWTAALRRLRAMTETERLAALQRGRDTARRAFGRAADAVRAAVATG